MPRPVVLSLLAVGALSAVPAASIAGGGGGDHHPPTAHVASTHVVRFGEYFFRAKRLTIHAGDRITFVNVGKIQHTVADSTRGGAVRSRVIHPRPLAHGQSQTVTFRNAGTIYYVCTFHPSLMRGVIVVRR